jgi:hypothetical protein
MHSEAKASSQSFAETGNVRNSKKTTWFKHSHTSLVQKVLGSTAHFCLVCGRYILDIETNLALVLNWYDLKSLPGRYGYEAGICLRSYQSGWYQDQSKSRYQGYSLVHSKHLSIVHTWCVINCLEHTWTSNKPGVNPSDNSKSKICIDHKGCQSPLRRTK